MLPVIFLYFPFDSARNISKFIKVCLKNMTFCKYAPFCQHTNSECPVFPRTPPRASFVKFCRFFQGVENIITVKLTYLTSAISSFVLKFFLQQLQGENRKLLQSNAHLEQTVKELQSSEAKLMELNNVEIDLKQKISELMSLHKRMAASLQP